MLSKILFATIMTQIVSQEFISVYGPGLKPQNIVMPARYFFIQYTNNDFKYTSRLAGDLGVEITGESYDSRKNFCRVWFNKLDRKDGTFIIRYKTYEKCSKLVINIYYKGRHIKDSPFTLPGPIYQDQCNCPQVDFESWFTKYECPAKYEQIENDLKIFKKVNMTKHIFKIVEKYHKPESISFCHYVIKNNEIYRNCYGKHVGFNMFADNILLFLSRKVKMPDNEVVINLGDWPLISKDSKPLPIFSWCGSDQTLDIVMPTYDITESTLENMGRVTLDMLSVQGGAENEWSQREPRAFWRGRDSRAERLKLVDIARENPSLFNVSLTNFFFFRDKQEKYGPKQPHVSFFKFFDYKYQINIDGTVAAYRFPYLLAGGSVVLKQDSPYYEHFYKSLKPWVHYIPVSRDLSDLKDRIIWARENDAEVKKIADQAKEFANENLLPHHVICYYAALFWEWSKKLEGEINVVENMTHVPQPSFDCECEEHSVHEEL